MPGLGSCTTDLNVVMMVDVLLEPGELVLAADSPVDPSGVPAAHDADMTEAQRRAEIDRMMRDLDVWERSPEGRRRLGVQASPPRPPPVEVRAKGRRRR